ncbi:MAG: hypothetical protein IIC71_06290 [Acidobacteria bacterium]|nr:hypothetical protein [Acidobacteriota bacterium]
MMRLGVRSPLLLVPALAFAMVAAACTTDNGVLPTDTKESLVEQPLARFELQGHRGARGLKPENTLPSFETALDFGVSTLELDLHFTADNEVVIWHDPVIDAKKCGLKTDAPPDIPDPDAPAASSQDLAVRVLTAAELRWFDCSRNPDAGRFPQQDSAATSIAGDDFGIVTFAELIEFVARYSVDQSKTDRQRENAARVRFNVETKRSARFPDAIGDEFDGTTAGPFELRLLDVIAAFEIRDRVTVQSFDRRSIGAINAVDPGISLAMLTSDESIELAAYTDVGATVWSPKAASVTKDRIAEAHRLGMVVIPWTVNESDVFDRLATLGVDGVITDRPDIFKDR